MARTVKERIIETAERLFAQRGIAGVSLREIGAAADQRNTRAVQYHFGSKQRLIEAILEYRKPAIDAPRVALLADRERNGRSSDPRALVEAMVYPLTESLKPGACFVRFIAQAFYDPSHSHVMVSDRTRQDGVPRIAAGMRKALSGLPDALLTQRLDFAWRLLVHALAVHERELETGQQPAVPTAASAAHLVEVLVAMMNAPAVPLSIRRTVPASRPGSRRVRTAISKRRTESA